MWLLKTEPSEFSYEDLAKRGEAVWDGVTNPAALKNLKAMRQGDLVLIYHTGEEKAVVGVAEVSREAYPDVKAKDPRRVVVDVRPIRRLASPVSLATIKSLAVFASSPLVRQGRLSVVPLSAAQWKAIDARGGA